MFRIFLCVITFDDNEKEVSGSTGETYTAKVFLGIESLSEIQSQNRNGIRFIILEETPNLDKTNFNKVLSKELKELEQHQLIKRVITNDYPVKISYCLEAYADTLTPNYLCFERLGVKPQEENFFVDKTCCKAALILKKRNYFTIHFNTLLRRIHPIY